MRVLLIEGDAGTAQTIELILKAEGINCETTDLGDEGLELADLYSYDLLILDLELPDMPGLDVLKALRLAKNKTPVMILSGASDIDLKVKTFAGGADDFLTKPFHRDELVARTRAIVRRANGHDQSVIDVGSYRINLDIKKVTTRAGVPIPLTGKEYAMLELLALRKGVLLTKEVFLNHLYGGRDEPEIKIIDVFICKLRRKLKGMAGEHNIETVWGRGYVLQPPSVASDELAAAA